MPTPQPPKQSTQPVMVVCGTILLLGSICAVVYLSNAQTNNAAALGIIGTIVASVLAGTFGLAKLAGIEAKVDQTVQQTNGQLDDRIHRVVTQALAERAPVLEQQIRESVARAFADRDATP